jgi:hypothetical protein
VRDLNPIQVEWIIWNLKQENEAMRAAMGHGGESGFQITGAKDAGGLLAGIQKVE